MRFDIPRSMIVYYEGRQAAKTNQNATTWEDILPYGVNYLVYPWLDGWNDERANKNPLLPFGVEGGRCPYCYQYELVVRYDGKLICMKYPCFQYPRYERIIDSEYKKYIPKN